MELGSGFAFVGQQYPLKVGEKDFRIDLLFYHTRLHCYIVVELKVTAFEPEFTGKLDFYLTAVDNQIKTPADGPSIGLLLCKSVDKVIVEYSLINNTKPIGVATYKHAVPDEWREILPDEALLKKELEKEIILPGKPIDQKKNQLKELLKKIKGEELEKEKDDNDIRYLYKKVIPEILKATEELLAEYMQLFIKGYIYPSINRAAFPLTSIELEARLLNNDNIMQLGLYIYLDGFKKAGTQAFTISKHLSLN